MSVNELLSQDEIDALLHGVDDGDIETASDSGALPEDLDVYDFESQDRIVRGRLPTLDMINERFTRQFRLSLFNMLRRNAEISVTGVQMIKFSEYLHTLFTPASLNLVKLDPMRGTSLIVLDPRLVFSVVDCFFGGNGQSAAVRDGREFTPTESRIIQVLLEKAVADLEEAWRPVLPVTPTVKKSEVNPQFANIVGQGDVVVVGRFHIEFDGAGGEFHVTMPYASLEPIRHLLDSGVKSENIEVDQTWRKALRQDVERAEIELSGTLAHARLSVNELLNMKAGDILPVEIPENVLMESEGIPLFTGKVGASRGNVAVKMNNWIEREEPVNALVEVKPNE